MTFPLSHEFSDLNLTLSGDIHDSGQLQRTTVNTGRR